MSCKKLLLSMTTVAAVALSGPSLAGTYPASASHDAAPMGNWYVQGFGGVGFTTNNNLRIANASPAEPRVSFDTGYDLGAAIGYRAGPWRGELQYTYLRSSVDKIVAFDSFPGGSVSGRNVVHGVLANGYYDFHGVSDFVTPFAGFGLGYARVNARAGTNPDINFHDNVFAYQVTGGVSYNVDNSFNVDISYRYFAAAKPSFYTKQVQNHLINVGITYHIPE